ncbi:hypothetical protein GM3708_3018 [Geminocystis sp. NIES-3708]|uniref:hypothetical protein n=1 Tax=Geminocystis sp. NIES-3708 TaxID=1615909 RepID=UPI0005FCACA9|nr:hypothetical protein [Geminocystis sp. NIES-3708]BAQ62612.1 hypothetical protein GM3708_3018 [Geminocystis sp. NIES-3708]
MNLNLVLLVLENFLRIFGLFWILGGIFALKTARESQFMDTCLEQIEGKKVDSLVTNFMFIGGILTLLSGIGLLLNNDQTIIILLILVISQLIYFNIKNKKFIKAKSEEEKEEYSIQSTTYNAFLTSIYITIVVTIKIIIKIIINL